MTHTLTRRALAGAILGGALCRAAPSRASSGTALQSSASDTTLDRANDAIAALEAEHGGRLGIAALETGSGRRISRRADERFAMCSTHKFLTCAAILAMVDQGQMKLDRHVAYGLADLLEYAPIARKNVDAGFMTVDALCAATMEWSDNTADDLLLGLIGGPAGWTRYARSIGDTVSRLDRTEPALNSAIPGDLRDTTTPEAMVRNLSAVLLGTRLSDASRERIENWLFGSKITANLLRAGLPNDWRIGDKSGSGENGSRNDIAIIRPPEAAPILVAVYYTESMQPLASREKVIAETGRIIAAALAV
jgi:beta-lactamase class A